MLYFGIVLLKNGDMRTLIIAFCMLLTSMCYGQEPVFINQKITYDDMRQVKFIQDASVAKDVNSINQRVFYCYIVKKEGAPPIMRIKTGIFMNDWIFFDRIIIAAGEKRSTIDVSSEDYNREVLDAGNVREVADVYIPDERIDILRTIAVSETSKVRLSGARYYMDIKINKRKKQAISNTLDAYDKLMALYLSK